MHRHDSLEEMSHFGVSKEKEILFSLHPPGSDFLGKQARTKNARIYNNVCNLLTHNLCMHFRLSCKVPMYVFLRTIYFDMHVCITSIFEFQVFFSTPKN